MRLSKSVTMLIAASYEESGEGDVKVEGYERFWRQYTVALRTGQRFTEALYLPDNALTAAQTAGEDLSVPLSVRSWTTLAALRTTSTGDLKKLSSYLISLIPYISSLNFKTSFLCPYTFGLILLIIIA